ncbi:MAG: hypothetical protein WBA76_04285 [Phormidesmis sp.]
MNYLKQDNTQSPTPKNNRLVVSYLMLRKSVGCLGMGLPFILALGGGLLFDLPIQPSISDYYHTSMRDVFVGVLFAMGVFLFSYKGYGKQDNWAANIAAVCVIGTALFPTTPLDPSGLAATIGKVHIAFATVYFITLAYFSLVLFTKSDPTRPATPQKLRRNAVYRVSGYTILLAIVLLVLLKLLPVDFKTSLQTFDPVFWLEAVMVIAFGISWYVKGEGILKDER